MTNIWVSVQVLPLALDGPANSLWQSTATAPGKITQSFLLDVDPSATISELFHRIDEHYKKNYLPTAQHDSFIIKKLQDEDGDDLAITFCVGDLPRNAKDKLVIRVVPAVMNRELSVPVASSLRPIDFARPSSFARPKRPAGFSEDGPNKRLRHDDVDYDTLATAYHPDQPIRSTERSLADFPTTSVDQSSPPPQLRPQGSYGDVIADSEDERRVAHSDDEPNEDEAEEDAEADEAAHISEVGQVSTKPHTSIRGTFAKSVQPVRDGSSPENNGKFKKPALPRSLVKETASRNVRKMPSPAVHRPTTDDQWRHAQPRLSQPDQEDDPFEIPDTDNENGQAPSAEHTLESVVSRQQSLQQLKKRRRSRGETSDLEQSPRPRSGEPERRTTKTYGSARSKKFSSATRLAFADSQSQPTPQAIRPFTPDLDGFEDLLAEPMPSREELARRRSREERNENAANAEITRQYFQTASAEKAKKFATLPITSEPNQVHMRQPSLSTRPTTTPSDVAGDVSPTPASRPLPSKDFPVRRTSSVSFVIPDDTTTSPRPQSPVQPPTVAGPSSSATKQKRNTPFSTPAARMRQTVVGSLINSHTPATGSSQKPEVQGSGKKAPACARCKTLKMACSATKTGLYPCEKCVKASIGACAPPNITGTPAPSSLRRSISVPSKSKGKAPERAPRAGTLDNLRIPQDQSTEAIDDSEYEDQQTPVVRRGTSAVEKAKASSFGKSTKQRAAGTILKPLTNPQVKAGDTLPLSNGSLKVATSNKNGATPPKLAEAFRTPSADSSPPHTEEVANPEPISQEDESPGSEGDVESNMSDEVGSGKNKSHGPEKQSGNISSISSKGGASNGTNSDDDDDDDESSSGSSEEEENGVASSKPVPAQKPSRMPTTPTPPQSKSLPASQASNSKAIPQSSGLLNSPVDKGSKAASTEENSASLSANFPTSSANAMTKLPSRHKSDDSDSDSSSSSSSAGSNSSADDVDKFSRTLAAAQRRHAGQGAVASSAVAPASAKVSKFGSVKNFISSTLGFSSSQHDNGGRGAWYNVPDSPESGL